MDRKRPTTADIRANKGKYQYTMMRVENWEELAAAREAGIDMCSVPAELIKKIRGKAFKEFLSDVQSGAYPSAPFLASTPKSEMDAFKTMMAKKN